MRHSISSIFIETEAKEWEQVHTEIAKQQQSIVFGAKLLLVRFPLRKLGGVVENCVTDKLPIVF